MVASWTPENHGSMTHPASTAAVLPCPEVRRPTLLVGRRGSRRSPASRRPTDVRSSRTLCATAAPIVASRRSRRLGRTRSSNRWRSLRVVEGRWVAISMRAPSMARPNGTMDGHTTSQARHWRQKPIMSAKVSSTPAMPSATAAIAVSLPRGDAVSSPVSRKVGQWGRHRPHVTQESSSTCVGASSVTHAITDRPPNGPGCRCRSDRRLP